MSNLMPFFMCLLANTFYMCWMDGFHSKLCTVSESTCGKSFKNLKQRWTRMYLDSIPYWVKFIY